MAWLVWHLALLLPHPQSQSPMADIQLSPARVKLSSAPAHTGEIAPGLQVSQQSESSLAASLAVRRTRDDSQEINWPLLSLARTLSLSQGHLGAR